MGIVVVLDFIDLKQRWQRARIAAAKSAFVPEDLTSFVAAECAELEVLLVRNLPQDALDRALKAVFDNSRQLALSASRHFAIRFELADFRELLRASQIACASGAWSVRKQAVVVEVANCPFAAAHEKRFCDWYREAIDGIVMGLGETERYVRHRSQAYGDEGCLDVIYDDVSDQGEDGFRYAALPAPIEQHLEQVKQRFTTDGFDLNWLGYRAGTVFYTLTRKDLSTPLCQGSARIAHKRLFGAVQELFPTLKMQDASPLAVYGEGTK